MALEVLSQVFLENVISKLAASCLYIATVNVLESVLSWGGCDIDSNLND